MNKSVVLKKDMFESLVNVWGVSVFCLSFRKLYVNQTGRYANERIIIIIIIILYVHKLEASIK